MDTRFDDHALADAVRRTRGGDTAAFADLYRALAPSVRHIVADNVRASHDIDDVVQDVFTRAFDRLASLRDPERFRPWLYSIARRAAIDHRRTRTAGRVVPDADPVAGTTDRDLGPDDLLILREELRALEYAADQLPARYATALTLVGYLDFTPAEIASAMGTSVGAAKVLVHRARQRLRGVLGEQEASQPGGGEVGPEAGLPTAAGHQGT